MSAPAAWSLLKQAGYQPDFVVQERAEDEARRQQPVEVWIHNDDFTPVEYVVQLLQEVFALGLWRATRVMLKAHFTGEALVATLPRKQAEAKVEAAEQRARRDGWPLRLSVQDAG